MKPYLLDKIPIIPGIVCYDTAAPKDTGLNFNVSIYGTVELFGHTFGRAAADASRPRAKSEKAGI